uniref:NADH-ubiquinone oxidoreductase chain 6 n=1 Tax=Acrasis kona TaxID=1008807 RepID=A0A0B4MZF4_9EUKA|nr:NADH dehydrogenase subunit 6 [Acrasis kona]AID52057.1 NADH dehydrogenase subunit 6 [Acrasis kona]
MLTLHFIIIIFCTIGVIINANPIYSILFLILSFISSSSLLLFLNLEFFALIFLIIYVGAISVFFIFIIMMISFKKIEEENKIYYIMIFLLFFLIVFLFLILLYDFETDIYFENELENKLSFLKVDESGKNIFFLNPTDVEVLKLDELRKKKISGTPNPYISIYHDKEIPTFKLALALFNIKYLYLVLIGFTLFMIMFYCIYLTNTKQNYNSKFQEKQVNKKLTIWSFYFY